MWGKGSCRGRRLLDLDRECPSGSRKPSPLGHVRVLTCAVVCEFLSEALGWKCVVGGFRLSAFGFHFLALLSCTAYLKVACILSAN